MSRSVVKLLAWWYLVVFGTLHGECFSFLSLSLCSSLFAFKNVSRLIKNMFSQHLSKDSCKKSLFILVLNVASHFPCFLKHWLIETQQSKRLIISLYPSWKNCTIFFCSSAMAKKIILYRLTLQFCFQKPWLQWFNSFTGNVLLLGNILL